MSEYSDFVSQYMREAKPKSLAEGRQAMKAAAAEWRAKKRRKNPHYTEEVCPACGTLLLVPAGLGTFTCPGCHRPLRQL